MVFVEDCNEGWLLLVEKGRCSSNINGFSPDEMSSAFPALLLPEPPLLYSPSSPELYVDDDTDEQPESRIIGGVPKAEETVPPLVLGM